ncbi:unnamed protein product [Candida verbasci]|uniref:Macro domain-containing protein n=1 Tax=Candida verbasci TaxID=1227364 RepID=A0A9W4TW58_9ASCO|nr:unnamed protein product [Candida verbasci]
METYNLYEIIRTFICQRYLAPFPGDINAQINKFIKYQQDSKLKTSIKSITTNYIKNQTIISLWKGDITTLTNKSAIVNTANSALLGCFQPAHKCIDNVIHSAAGPDLRQACFEIIQEQGHEEETEGAKITPGFNLDAK